VRISIFGMGYVGAVCSACFAEDGHEVIGVDVSDAKVDQINSGQSPIVEPGLADLIRAQVESGRLRATTDAEAAVRDTDLSMICVGTPSQRNGDLDMRFVRSVAENIGRALKHKNGPHTVVVRSTVLPGTTRQIVIPTIESASGKRAGEDFGVGVNPEFLRESTAIKDYREPPMTVIGELDAWSGDQLYKLYESLPAPIIRKPIEVAEMVKYTCNTWHAAKVTFANEIGNIAKSMGIDGRDVMEVVCMDRKLNISDYYMKPGFAFGGSCLPKDVRALTHRAGRLDVEHPMIAGIMRSNQQQVDRAMEIIESFGERRVGMLGLSFKADTDDLRESPMVTLAESLIGKGFDLTIYDRNVDYARVHGANRDYINKKIPHVSSLLRSDIDEVIGGANLMVLGNRDRLIVDAFERLPQDKKAVDLVGLMTHTSNHARQGICW